MKTSIVGFASAKIISMKKSEDHYRKILDEQLVSQLKAINEGIDSIHQRLDQTATKEDLERFDKKDKVFEAAIKDLSRMVAEHDQRLKILEASR